MGKITKLDCNKKTEDASEENEIIQVTENLLLDAQTKINKENALSVPIAELATLGAGIASLIPALNTATQTTKEAADNLYRWANADVGYMLKKAQDGSFWGAAKNPDGISKFAKFQSVDQTTQTTTLTAINPATMMIAVALFSIEKELGHIAEMEKQIITFLEVEKEAEIEADVETLMNIITNYKHNWDNEYFVSSNHKLVLDIQRTARKNMNVYQKNASAAIESKQLLVMQNKVNSTLYDLEKKFKYYRLSIYTYSFASLIEIMLSGNFKEDYISKRKDEIVNISEKYREMFSESSQFLEKIGVSALETNVLRGIGSAGKTVGKVIGSIPLVKEGPVDEFLQDSGSQLRSKAVGTEKKALKEFATVSNPETRVFIDKMEEMIRIYNHTDMICFDSKKIYLVANQ